MTRAMLMKLFYLYWKLSIHYLLWQIKKSGRKTPYFRGLLSVVHNTEWQLSLLMSLNWLNDVKCFDMYLSLECSVFCWCKKCHRKVASRLATFQYETTIRVQLFLFIYLFCFIFLTFYFTWVFIQVLFTCSPMKPRAVMYRTVWL